MKRSLFVFDSEVRNRVEKIENSICSAPKFIEISLDLSLTCPDEKIFKK